MQWWLLSTHVCSMFMDVAVGVIPVQTVFCSIIVPKYAQSVHTVIGGKKCMHLCACLHESSVPGESTDCLLSLRHDYYTQYLSAPESKVLWHMVDVNPLVPYDWTKGHKTASDTLCLLVTFSVAFHFFPRSTDTATETVRATVSSLCPLLPLGLSYTKAVSGTKTWQLSHITTQVRNAWGWGVGWVGDKGHTGMRVTVD